MKNATLKLLINGFVWIVVLSFIAWCVVGGVLEFFVNTLAHKRVAFYYNTLHNRCVRALVGSMVGLACLYNLRFGEKYLVQFQLAVADPKSNNKAQPKGIVISDFRFGIAKHPAGKNRPYNWKRPWLLPKETHDVSWFVLNWKQTHHISVEFKVYKWKIFSWRTRWLRCYISPQGVLRHNYLLNAGAWFYAKTQNFRQVQWIVKFPSFVSSLFAPNRYDVMPIGIHTVNGMSRVSYFNAVYEIEYAPLVVPPHLSSGKFCVFCSIIGKQESHPPKPVMQRKLVYKIPTLEYIRWCVTAFPYSHGHKTNIDQAEKDATQSLGAYLNKQDA